ncbi:MAG: hypothetical protein J0M15_12610 [Deltaproteobacteria bacterium]|jgi:hypothetical protein|nr:hypothetical protein [Deltaproteobacteria bacterium]
MKAFIFLNLLLIIFLSNSANAVEKFQFNYNFHGDSLFLTQEAEDPNQALKIAAKICFKHFKGQGKISEERGLDIIDICANPKN